MDSIDIIQAPSSQHQGNECGEEHDELALLRHGQLTPMAGFG